MKKIQPLLPVDLSLPERVLMEDDSMFVTLPTLDELEQFWNANRGQFAFACEGVSTKRPTFLREYEWIFGPTRTSVVRAVMRWDRLNVGCEFYDRASVDPAIHEAFFKDRDEYRESQMLRSRWTSDNELAYREDCLRRSHATYRGWWQLKNLPRGYDPDTWFNPAIAHEELFDPAMLIEEVARKLQEQTFDDWKQSDVNQLAYHDRQSIAEVIAYWRSEAAAGRDYYGREHERERIVAAPN